MVQSYHTLLLGAIPSTRKASFVEYSKSRYGTIKSFLLQFLPNYPDGLSCRSISDLTGIYVQSLTYPLKSLQDAGMIEVKGVSRDEKTNRLVQLYGIRIPSDQAVEI